MDSASNNSDLADEGLDAAAARFRWVVLGGLWLIYCTFGMVTVSLAPLVPQIMSDLAIGHTMMGAIFGAWQLAFIVAAIPCGSLLDRIGVRRGLLLGTLAIAASAMLRGIATDAVTMLLAVAVFGIGGPIVSTGAPKVVTQWFEGKARGLAMGVYVTGPAVGGILALSLTNPVLLPVFDGDWRSVQWVWAGCALIAGVIWIAIAQHPLMRARDRHTSAGARISQLKVIAELLQIPAVRVLLFMSVGIFAFNHGLNNWLPEILRAKAMTATEAGYWATIPTVIGLIGSLTIPRLATPERRTTVLIGLCVFAVLATLLLRADVGVALVGGLILQGVARSSLMTVAILTLVETPKIGEARAATASGMFFSAAEIGGAGGPLMLGLIHAGSGGFAAGMNFLTGVTMLLLLGAFWLRNVAVPATRE